MSRDLDAMARTIWGEARGEPWAGKLAVAHVIKNRADRGGWWGGTVYAVCHKAKQFSCWDDQGDGCRAVRLELDRNFRECYAAAAHVLHGGHRDNTNGSTHYHTNSVWPRWSEGKEPAVVIENHKFFNNIG